MSSFGTVPPHLDATSASRSLQVTAREGRLLLGLTCFFLVLCVAAVTARVASRRITRASIQADDYLVFLALVSRRSSIDPLSTL